MGHYETSFNTATPDAKGRSRQRVSKRQTGSSAQSAQQIPWPEIFKRHISLIEGHLKMTEMIKKHTVERSANWETICNLIDQTKVMLQKTKLQSQILIPQFNIREKVPLRSSSRSSIHPEYFVTNNENGNAAKKHERPASATSIQGVDSKPTKFDDAFSQGTKSKRPKLGDAGSPSAVYESSPMNATDSGSDRLVANSPKPRTVNGQDEGQTVESNRARSANVDSTAQKQEPLFFVDVNPTPVNLAGIAIKSPKRGPSLGDNDEGKKAKKTKTYHNNDEEQFPLEKPEVEFEDISQEVDARLKEKEEKRKRRKEKKRKKSANFASDVGAPDAITTAEEPARPKKKKRLRQNHDALVETTEVKKTSNAESDEGQSERRKKKRKKNKETKDS